MADIRLPSHRPRRIAGVLLALGCVALAAGEVASAAALPGPAQARQGGTLTALWEGDVDSIDPGITYDLVGWSVAAATQRSLLSYRPDDVSRPVPDVAASLPEVAPNGRSVTVRLREGVRFSPPVDREVTSRDVRYAIERGFFRTVENPYVSTYFGDLVGARTGARPGTTIAGLETPDDRTLVLRLARRRGGAVAAALVLPVTAPVPAEYAARFDRARRSGYGRRQVATGPYMIDNDGRGRAVGYRPGRRIRLVRNPSWDPAADFRPARLDRIDIRQDVRDRVAGSRRVLRGRQLVTGDFEPPAGVLRTALRRRPDQVASVSGGAVEYLTLNTRLAPFDDVDVRRAVVAGFDRLGWRRAAGGRLAGPLATHFIPPGVPGYKEAGGRRGSGSDLYARAGGSRRDAARHLRRAGFPFGRYTGGTRILTIGSTGPDGRAKTRVVRRSLGRLGFRVKVSLVDDDEVVRTCLARHPTVHLCPASWGRDFSDAQGVLDPLFAGETVGRESTYNWSQLDVPAVNRAIETAGELATVGERARAWAEVDRLVVDQAPAVALVWPRDASLRSRDVDGVISESSGLWDLSFTGLR
jgi:peptide/nickel transport system substrate-binding protein